MPRVREDKTPINGELHKAGGFGKFQWFIVVSMILGQMSGGFIAHGIAYLELPPVYPGYLCKNTTDPTSNWEECAPKPATHDYDAPNPSGIYYCDEQPDIAYEVDYAAADRNLYNFYTWLNLACKPKRATALIAMFVFAGSAIGCLFMPRLGDLIGRKTIFCTSLAFQVPLLAGITYFRTLPPVYAVGFLFGICVVGRMACGFLLMMELVPTEH